MTSSPPSRTGDREDNILDHTYSTNVATSGQNF